MSPKYAKDQPAGFTNRIEKVAIVGVGTTQPTRLLISSADFTPQKVGGRIGSYFAKHLLATGKHTVTALTRAGSKAQLPEGVLRTEIDYDDEPTLAAALRGQDFLVITLSPTAGPGTELKLIRAAARAGVKHVMPNAYGPDPLNEAMMTEILIGRPFLAARAEVEKLGASSWIALGCGFWYEWSLCGNSGRDCFGCGVEDRTVTFFDDGAEKITTTTWDQCGRALAALLSLKVYPEDESDTAPAVDSWANQVVYVSSFRVSQRDMFESVKRVTGTTDADWKIEHVSSEKRFKEGVERMKGGDRRGFAVQMYTRIFFPTGEGDHTRLGLANEELGLPVEDIDESTKEGFRLLKQGILTY